MIPTASERALRNVNPHAEAAFAMIMWGHEYAKQNGGCMDFWDALDPYRKRIATDAVTSILSANAKNGRARRKSERTDAT